jgi:hypothetical protein
MTINKDPANGTAEPTIRNAHEETPLLQDQTKSTSADEENVEQETSEETVIPEELSTRRLVVTLGSIYVGVFLGVSHILGNFSRHFRLVSVARRHDLALLNTLTTPNLS